MLKNMTPRELVKLALEVWSEDTINATDDALVGYMAGAIETAVAEQAQRADAALAQVAEMRRALESVGCTCSISPRNPLFREHFEWCPMRRAAAIKEGK